MGLMGYGLIGVLLILGAMGVALKVQTTRLEHAQEQVAVERARVQRYVEAEAVTQQRIAEQNTAIEALRQDGENAMREAQAAIAAAKARGSKLAEREAALRARETTGDPCKDSGSLLRRPL